jgi:hypothetical protein
VFDSRFARLLPPGLNASQFGGAIGWGSIRSIHPPALEEQVVAAIANSLRVSFLPLYGSQPSYTSADCVDRVCAVLGVSCSRKWLLRVQCDPR